MLHCVHQLVSNCVSLLFAAEQVVYSGVLKVLNQNDELKDAKRYIDTSQVIILCGL